MKLQIVILEAQFSESFFFWLQHFDPVIDWVKYEVTLPSGFVVAAVPVTTSPWVELCTLKGLLHTLWSNKHTGSWFALVK